MLSEWGKPPVGTELLYGRFMSGLTVKTPHCVSCTVICSCVLSSHRIQLQEELVLGCVSSDRDSTFERWVVVSATTVVYVAHPFQFVSWKLPDPVPVITTGDGVASDRAGERQRLRRFHEARS